MCIPDKDAAPSWKCQFVELYHEALSSPFAAKYAHQVGVSAMPFWLIIIDVLASAIYLAC